MHGPLRYSTYIRWVFFTYPPNLDLVLLPEAKLARLHPQWVAGVVGQATHDGCLVVENDESRRGLPADSLESLRFGLQLTHGSTTDGCKGAEERGREEVKCCRL